MAKIQLKGITWDHPRGFDPLVAASELYAKMHNVDIVWHKRTLKDFGDQSLEELANSYDFLIMDHPHSGVLAAKNSVVPLDEFVDVLALKELKEQSGGPSLDSYNYKGHQWALPVDAAYQCAAYRKDLLNQPVPERWEEALKIEGMGMALCPTDSLCSFLSLTSQFGSPIKEENSILVEKSIGVKVLDFMKTLVKKSHPKSLEWNPIELYDVMSETNEVFYSPLAFGYTNYSRIGYKKQQLTFTNPPEILGAVLGGAGIAISSQCRYKKEAVDFASWICSAEIQGGIYVEALGQPANKKALLDKVANSITNDFFKNTFNGLESAFVRPRFETWPIFQEMLGEVVHEALKKDDNSEKIITYLNQEYQKIKPSLNLC